LSKLSIIFKEWRSSYEQCGQGRSYCSLYTLDNIHRLFFCYKGGGAVARPA
jgi:hypothetical protein